MAKQLSSADTVLLVTRFVSADGVAEVQDFAPANGPQRLVRRIVCVRGEVRLRLECEPRFDDGRDCHSTQITPGGAVFRSPTVSLALRACVPLAAAAAGVSADFTLAAGESTAFVLEDPEG